MQWVAMLTMLIDHVGMVFFPHDPLWRMIGRIAFPIYAFGIVQGMARTTNLRNYVIRLFLIGAAAQIGFFALGIFRPNVIFSFLLAILLFWLLDRIEKPFGKSLLIIGSAISYQILGLEYGAFGLLLLMCYRYVSGWRLLVMHGLLLVLAVTTYGPLEVCGLAGTILILAAPKMWNVRSPAWLWRSFYPAHLLLLGLAKHLFTG